MNLYTIFKIKEKTNGIFVILYQEKSHRNGKQSTKNSLKHIKLIFKQNNT